MKVWIDKRDLKHLKEMQDEGKTRIANISSFKIFEDDREIEVELNG